MKNNKVNKLEIDLFLKQIQLLSKLNKIEPKHIYYQLTTQNMPDEEIRKDLSEEFEIFQETNLNNKNLEVFVAGNWPYFCQFKSKEAWRAREINPIKIYVPLKKKNITKSIQRIFDFITANNIEHCSKLARETRIDDLVIRVFKKEDADKIIEFINNEKELSGSMYESNPFTIINGNVGLAMDRIMSYNDTLANYIYDYINKTNEKNQIANIEDFKKYLQENLKQMKEKGDLSTQIKMCTGNNFKRLPQALQTIEEITNLIIKVIEGSSKEIIYEEFERLNDPAYNKNQQLEYQQFDYMKFINDNHILLNQLFRTMSYKYGYNKTIENLKEYRLTGDLNLITRTNNLREKIEKSRTFRTYINYIDLESTLKDMIPKVEKPDIKPSKHAILEEICKQTYIACQTEERGYSGKIQVARSLVRMTMNNFDSITRQKNARSLAKENLNPKEIRELVEKTLEDNGYIIENEEDLYELYATHIEHICEKTKKVRGR